MSKAPIYLERSGDIAFITFNRPDKRNALTLEIWQAVPRLVDEAEADSAVKVVIVRGIDSSAFAAGADIAEFGRINAMPDGWAAYYEAVGQAQRRLANCAKATIAMVQGPCVGGGCGIALCCDLRLADPTARFGITPARLGLAYGLEDTKRLVDVVGAAKAKDMLFSGRILGAEEALRIGLIDQLVPADRIEAHTLSYAAELCRSSQYSVRSIKAIIRMILDGAAVETEASRRLVAGAVSGPDYREGVAAFLEKRPPNFPTR